MIAPIRAYRGEGGKDGRRAEERLIVEPCRAEHADEASKRADPEIDLATPDDEHLRLRHQDKRQRGHQQQIETENGGDRRIRRYHDGKDKHEADERGRANQPRRD